MKYPTRRYQVRLVKGRYAIEDTLLGTVVTTRSNTPVGLSVAQRVAERLNAQALVPVGDPLCIS